MTTDNTQDTSCRNSETVHAEQACPKVLCVDDDPNISEALARSLHNYDVEVLRAYHGMHGFWLAMTESPDVIITDLQMPQGAGEEIIECLKRNSDTASIPIIVLTGKSDPGLEARIFRLGAEHFLPKPAAFDEMLDKLGQYITLRKRVSK